MSDVDKWIEIAKRCKYLPEDDLRELCNIVCDLLLEEPNVQPVQTPVTVCGDIHGQFYDLEELFHIGGQVPHTKYIFMGDYVDRGYYSLETLTLLMALKARYPDRMLLRLPRFCSASEMFAESHTDGFQAIIRKKTASLLCRVRGSRNYILRAVAESYTPNVGHFVRRVIGIILLRGNHETCQITKVYGFYDECLNKYGNANAWKDCCRVFDLLTVAALIDETVLCVHGGLSPEISMLDQIRCIDRNQQIPHKGAFCDLLWSDPADVKMWSVSPRGAGWLFGSYVTELFMNYNNLNLICRAHQLVNEGYKYMFDKRLVTVWSAPNYCYRCGNVASILEFNTVNDRTAKLFQAVPDGEREVPPQHTTPYFL